MTPADQATEAATSFRAAPGEPRRDLLLHAFAQGPEAARLALGPEDGDGKLGRLARAYALQRRVTFDGAERHGAAVSSGAVVSSGVAMAELAESFGDAPSAWQRDDEALAGQRVAIVTNVPAPYRVPLFNTMARRLAAVDGQLRVYFQSLGARGRPWIGSGGEMEFAHEVMPSIELPMGFRRPRLSAAIGRPVRRFEPTLVLCGSLSPITAPRVATAARRAGAAFGLWSGEVAWRPTAAGAHRRLVRQQIARAADFAVAYGFQAGEYLRELHAGLPLVYGRNSSSAYAAGRRRPSRPDVVELLTVADLSVPGKQVGTLVEAVLMNPSLPCRLTVVGGGEEARAELERRVGDDGRIRFLGAVPQSRVRECYADSDVYLFPSQIDVFGLALVEAMGSGLAPITATRPGVASDLAVHGRNCLTVAEPDPAAWGDAIERLVLDHELRTALGAAAQATIRRRWTIDHACEGMFAGLRLGLFARGQVAG
jgi:hypothetical protein